MVKIAVAGTSEFIVGFQLAGIKDVIEINENYFSQLKNLKNRKDIGIIVVEQKIVEGVEPHERFELDASVEPVFITLSTKFEQDSLKRLIKKSIGVDLWK